MYIGQSAYQRAKPERVSDRLYKFWPCTLNNILWSERVMLRGPCQITECLVPFKLIVDCYRRQNTSKVEKCHPTSVRTDVYGRSGMLNYTLSFELYVGQW